MRSSILSCFQDRYEYHSMKDCFEGLFRPCVERWWQRFFSPRAKKIDLIISFKQIVECFALNTILIIVINRVPFKFNWQTSLNGVASGSSSGFVSGFSSCSYSHYGSKSGPLLNSQESLGCATGMGDDWPRNLSTDTDMKSIELLSALANQKLSTTATQGEGNVFFFQMLNFQPWNLLI